jgi:MFS family permease
MMTVILAGLLLTLLLAALDSTIVATAMPRIVGELGGFDRYTWITTAYLLTSTVAVPIVGKLADQYGRRPFLLGGTVFFLAASMLCSVAGMAVAAGGLWLMGGMGPQTDYPVVARNLVIIGLGLGSALSSFAVAAQNAVPTHQTGVATALGTFARSMGGTVASAALGGLLAAQLGTTAAVALPPSVLADALHATFLAAVSIVVLGMLATLWMREVPLRARV